MSGHGDLYDSVKHIVAKLYVLRDSCAGIIHTEKSSQNLIWVQGAEAVLKEAVDELQEALRALEDVVSVAEKEGKDLAYVERLIKKLDKFSGTRNSLSPRERRRDSYGTEVKGSSLCLSLSQEKT